MGPLEKPSRGRFSGNLGPEAGVVVDFQSPHPACSGYFGNIELLLLGYCACADTGSDGAVWGRHYLEDLGDNQAVCKKSCRRANEISPTGLIDEY